MCENDPQSLMAPRHLHKIDREDSEHEGACFQKRLAATIILDFQSAVRLVREHFPRHLGRLSGDLLFRIGVAFYQNADMEKARYCLELAAAKDGAWQHKAMLLISRTYEAIGNDQRALSVIQDLLDLQPDKIFRRQAMKRMMQLQSQDNPTHG
jgi:tetratricopeptide (TPR) repeat protein